VVSAPASARAAASAPAEPRRRLTLFDVLCIGVNAIVGSGVFALPDDMHRAMGGWSPFAFALCSLLLLPVALCFAELAGQTDETGGPYVYARRAFGPRAGFLIGWYCWANTFVSWAANATLVVALVGVHSPSAARVAAALVVLALGAVNYVGVKPGAWVVNAMVIGKLAAIASFLLVALFWLDPSRFGGALPTGIAGVGRGVYLALFPLQGFEVTPVTAGETQNPRRNVPLATLGALLLSALLFIGVQAALVATYPDLARVSDTPLADGARHLGPVIGAIVLIGSVISVGGFTAGSALGSPRYAQAIAAHGLLPRSLARVHPRFETPYVAIVVTTLLTAIAAAAFDYRQLVGMSNITVCIQYLFTCLAVPVLRRKAPPAERGGFRVPGGALVPAIGAAGSIALLAGTERVEVAFAAGTLVVGVAVAALTARAAARAA
jgi:amino acid transporter